MHYFEGLEIQLRNLEDEENKFNSDSSREEEEAEILACTNCFELEKECECEEQVLWPIRYVIVKLRWLLRRRLAS